MLGLSVESPMNGGSARRLPHLLAGRCPHNRFLRASYAGSVCDRSAYAVRLRLSSSLSKGILRRILVA